MSEERSLIRLDELSVSIQYLLDRDKRLSKVIKEIGPIEYRIHENGFEFLASQIIGQMLSNKVARIIFDRFYTLCQEEVTPERILSLDDDEIKGIGTANSKVVYLKNLAEAVENNSLNLQELKKMDDNEAMISLMKVKGIGSWSAKMYLIFVLDRQDVLPYEDVAFLQGFKWMHKTENAEKDIVIKKCKKWSPYASIGARYMYRALDMGLTKNEFHLFK